VFKRGRLELNQRATSVTDTCISFILYTFFKVNNAKKQLPSLQAVVIIMLVKKYVDTKQYGDNKQQIIIVFSRNQSI